MINFSNLTKKDQNISSLQKINEQGYKAAILIILSAMLTKPDTTEARKVLPSLDVSLSLILQEISKKLE